MIWTYEKLNNAYEMQQAQNCSCKSHNQIMEEKITLARINMAREKQIEARCKIRMALDEPSI